MSRRDIERLEEQLLAPENRTLLVVGGLIVCATIIGIAIFLSSIIESLGLLGLAVVVWLYFRYKDNDHAG